MRILRWTAAIVGVPLIGGLAVFGWILAGPGPTEFASGKRVALADYRGGNPTGVPHEIAQGDPIKRGEYLARAADCVACHTPSGAKPFSGGFAFKLPFGTLFSPNITPDRETGIGSWADDEFVRAMQGGVGRDGKRLYPAFPYTSYTALTRDDVLAIKAYLFSQPAVSSRAPDNELAFPFNQRWAIGMWGVFFNPNERFRPIQTQSVLWNRGAYLAEALVHCGECHTPRTLAMSLNNRLKFAGALVDGWRAYNVSSDATSGIGAWSEEELMSYLSTGHAAGRGTASGSMAEAIDNGTRFLTPEDIKALAVYVRSVPAIKTDDEAAPPDKVATAVPDRRMVADDLQQGQRLFEGACVSCHAWNGDGAVSTYAALAGSRSISDPTATNLTQVLLHGSIWKAADGRQVMPAFGSAFSDAEIAALANFVTARFGSRRAYLTADDVKLRRND